MKKLKNSDIIFFISLVVLSLSILIIALLTLSSNAKEKVTPTTTNDTPSLLRPSRVSLNPNIMWEINAGGSKQETISGVLELNDYIIYGTTNSTDYDFNGKGNKDLYLLSVSKSGLVKKSITFGTSGNDNILDIKPVYIDSKVNFFVTCQNDKSNHVYLYKIDSDLTSFVEEKIELENTTTVKKVLITEENLYMLCDETISEKTYLTIIKISLDLKTIELKSFEQNFQISVVDAVLGEDSIIILFNIIKTKYDTVAFASIGLKNETLSSFETFKEFYNNSNRVGLCLNITDIGYIVMCKTYDNATSYFCLLGIDFKFNEIFDKTLSKYKNFQSAICTINRNSDYGNFFVYLTKEQNNTFDTIMICYCLHGDLIYENTQTLKGILPVAVNLNTNGQVIIGTRKSLSQYDICLVVIDNNSNIVFKEVFGGSNSDVPVKMLEKQNGNIIVFAVTGSNDKDVGSNFGKTDIWVFEVKMNI